MHARGRLLAGNKPGNIGRTGQFGRERFTSGESVRRRIAFGIA